MKILHSSKNPAKEQVVGVSKFVESKLVNVASIVIEDASTNAPPEIGIRSVRTPLGAKTFPDGTKTTSSRLVT